MPRSVKPTSGDLPRPDLVPRDDGLQDWGKTAGIVDAEAVCSHATLYARLHLVAPESVNRRNTKAFGVLFRSGDRRLKSLCGRLKSDDRSMPELECLDHELAVVASLDTNPGVGLGWVCADGQMDDLGHAALLVEATRREARPPVRVALETTLEMTRTDQPNSTLTTHNWIERGARPPRGQG